MPKSATPVPTVTPNLLLATDIAAGLDGIEQGMEPSEATLGNAYELEDADPIPTNISDAIAQARGSGFMKSVLGDDLFELYVSQSEREAGFIENQVTPAESERYLINF